jgi:hypothetical protein
MASLPSANTTVSDQASVSAGGTDVVCVVSPVPNSADAIPRFFGSAQDVFTQHGYCDGVEYVALHRDRTRKPVLFVGIPIVTQGAIGRVNSSGNTGTSVVTVTAGGSGVLPSTAARYRSRREE